jgi:hypothetical protein
MRIELPLREGEARGCNINFKVQPNHVMNPSYGNAYGGAVFPNAATPGFPFSKGQFDPHEGISSPDGVLLGAGGSADYVPRTTDNVNRLPAGFFIVAYEGYRILQTTAVTR